MAATSPFQRKPYLLLEYFPLSARWHDCHVKEAGAQSVNLADRIDPLMPAPCKFCAVQMQDPPKLTALDSIFAECVRRTTAPSSHPRLEMKSPGASFNHVHDFMIHEGIIWFRRQSNQDQTWTPIYFDGFPEGIVPCSIHADGANLVVLDEQGYVHYKKVLREHRRSDLVTALAVRDGWPIQAPYIAIDKAAKNNWKTAWFTLPVLSGIVNLFDGKKIKIPSDALAWGISHRGTYNHCYEDDEGIEHPVNTGVTTLYVLLKNGKDILKLDPWSPPKAKMNLQVTDTPDATFRAFDMSPSASTLMLIGYETRAAHHGGTIKTLKIKTRLADIDTEGLNPGIKYTYFKERTNGETIRVISRGEWQEHALPTDPLLFLTGEITLLQTGEGNQARELRLEAYGPQRQLGYYRKMILDDAWVFKPYETQPQEDKEPIPLQIESDEPFETTVHNWIAEDLTFPGRVPTPKGAKMLNFGKYSETSILVFYYPDGEERLILRRRKTLLNFLGATGHVYDLLNYAEDIEKAKLGKLFPIFDKRQERVFIEETGAKVTIRGFHFCVVFKKI